MPREAAAPIRDQGTVLRGMPHARSQAASELAVRESLDRRLHAGQAATAEHQTYENGEREFTAETLRKQDTEKHG